MRVLICGVRNFDNDNLFYGVIDPLRSDISVVIHGGARGADTLANAFARAAGIPVLQFDALWDVHGKSAGPIRNRRMLEEGKPDLVIAFPGGRGTAHMVKIAKEAGIEVREVN